MHTVKVQILVRVKDNKVLKTSVSEGKKHDFEILKESKILRCVGESMRILGDSGYQGIKKLREKAQTPIKKKKGQELTKEEKKANKELARERIIVENIIGGLKIFKMIATKYRNRRKKIKMRINLICALYNIAR
jgi:hypothetical protein